MSSSFRRTLAIAVTTAIGGIAIASLYVWWARTPVRTAEQPLAVTSTRATEASAVHRFVVDLPAITGMPDVEEQRALNTTLRRPMLDAMHRIEAQAWLERPDLRGEAPHEYRVTFAITRFTDRVVSMKIQHLEQTGGVHPLAFVTTFSYDFALHRILTLDDLFARADEPYLHTLTRFTNARLLDQLGLDRPDGDPAAYAWVDRGTAPEAKHFDAFTLTERGIAFWFDPTEVAPSAAGILSVEIPFAELRGIAREGSVVDDY